MAKKPNAGTPDKAKPADKYGMTEEDLADLDEYEKSPEGMEARKTKPEGRAAQLTKLFFQTPEGKEFRETVDAINNGLDPEDTVPITIHVPRQFIRMTDFLEGKRAAGAGVSPRAADKVINQIALNELHDELHWLVVAPGRFEYFRNLWNRFCDAQGAPEEKIADPAGTPATGNEEGPF